MQFYSSGKNLCNYKEEILYSGLEKDEDTDMRTALAKMVAGSLIIAATLTGGIAANATDHRHGVAIPKTFNMHFERTN